MKIWSIPEGGLTETITTPLLSLTGHRRKVLGLAFHPTVSTLLASTSSDGYTKLWDLETGQNYNNQKPTNDANYYDIIWDTYGTTYLTAMRDKCIHCIDARNNNISMTFHNVYDSNSCIKLVNLYDDFGRLLTVGKSKNAVR